MKVPSIEDRPRRGPFGELTVLDLSTVLAGPGCARLLTTEREPLR
jgi:crotonobetainyl-CoA:carnitine CoA-transferase CaiB-like acyl-CoA transferase